MTQKEHVDTENEFILIRIPKSIDPTSLNGMKLYLKRKDNDERENLLQTNQNDYYGYDYSTIDNDQTHAFYSMNKLSKIDKSSSSSNDQYFIDQNARLKGCLNIYKHAKSYHQQQVAENSSETMQTLEPKCPNDPVDVIIHRNKRKYVFDDADMKKMKKSKHRHKQFD